MPITMYSASVPVFIRALESLAHVLHKGEAHAKAKNIAPEVLLQTRLIPDMFPLLRQIQIAADHAKNDAARLAGVEPPRFEDTETTFDELFNRIDRAVAYLKTFKPEQIDGSETREIQLKMRSGTLDFNGQDFLTHFALPNLYFHTTTAYDILRASGVDIGKADFLGGK